MEYLVRHKYRRQLVINLDGGNVCRLGKRGDTATILEEERKSPELVHHEQKGRVAVTQIEAPPIKSSGAKSPPAAELSSKKKTAATTKGSK